VLNRGDEQIQQVGDGATAYQATGNIVINKGLSYSDVRDVALDVFRSNFLQLAGEAKDVARQRAEEITDKFLEKLQKENPIGLNQAQTPDFQYGLFAVQRDFARTADKDLGDLLVDLLVDRTKHPERDMVQIVLNECLLVAPKLTNEQLSALTVIFQLKYCRTAGILTFDQLRDQLDKFLRPFVETLPRSATSYRHLEFAGCGTAQVTSHSLEELLWTQYQGLFDKGVAPNELSGAKFYFNRNQQLTGVCGLDPSKIQVRAQNLDHLEHLIVSNYVLPDDARRLREVFGKNRLGTDEIKAKCIECIPSLRQLFDLWSVTGLHNMTLTSVGIGLAHANIKRIVGEFTDLSIWLN
jgi:hypothetical protein